jgi:hypothetical protein
MLKTVTVMVGVAALIVVFYGFIRCLTDYGKNSRMKRETALINVTAVVLVVAFIVCVAAVSLT